jgi:iron complex outermembrane receptor protein
MNKTLCGAACVALIMPCGTPALAQTMNINVPVGQQGSLTSQGTLAAKEAIKNIPGGADVVPAKTFKEGYALSMKDMLATTPGVLAQPRWGEESRLSIRGSGLSRSFHLRGITLLQDGVPFNFSDGSGDFQEIDPLILQHVEVYRGGQGLRYGAATLGGAINMVTPTARSVEHNALLRIEAGSHQTLRLHAQAAKTFKHADIIASATSAVSDGARLQSEQNNRRFSSNVGFTLNRSEERRVGKECRSRWSPYH